MLQDKRASYTPGILSTCELCGETTEDLEHFLLKCKVLQMVRIQHVNLIYIINWTSNVLAPSVSDEG